MAYVMYIISKVEKIQSPMKIVEMAHAQHICSAELAQWTLSDSAPFCCPWQSDQVVGKSGTMKRIRTCAKTSNQHHDAAGITKNTWMIWMMLSPAVYVVSPEHVLLLGLLGLLGASCPMIPIVLLTWPTKSTCFVYVLVTSGARTVITQNPWKISEQRTLQMYPPIN